MKKEYTIEQMAGSRWFYKFTDTNEKGEELIIELKKCEDNSYKDSLPKLWKKNGYIDRVLKNYWSIQTYVTDTEENCCGKYNPQEKLSDDRQTRIINFNWMSEATEENKGKLINEVYRLFSSAKGESATEKKYKKIKEYAKEHNIDMYKTIPSEWKIVYGALTAPQGTVWISNMKSFKSGKRKKGILLVG